MAFDGFPDATFAFLKGLEADNTRDWMTAHRAEYERDVLAPSLDFIAALGGRLAAFDPPYAAEPRVDGSFRRLNRDVRFAADKTPYAARLHFVFWTGAHPMRSPAFHVVLHPDGWGYGAGEWQWPPARLDAFRLAVRDPARRAALAAAVAGAPAPCRLAEPELKRPPAGIAADAPEADWLRRKSLVCRTHESQTLPETADSALFLDSCARLAAALHPLNAWLAHNLP